MLNLDKVVESIERIAEYNLEGDAFTIALVTTYCLETGEKWPSKKEYMDAMLALFTAEKIEMRGETIVVVEDDK